MTSHFSREPGFAPFEKRRAHSRTVKSNSAFSTDEAGEDAHVKIQLCHHSIDQSISCTLKNRPRAVNLSAAENAQTFDEMLLYGILLQTVRCAMANHRATYSTTVVTTGEMLRSTTVCTVFTDTDQGNIVYTLSWKLI